MILNINESIDKETVDKIAKAINELKPSEKLFIYFSSYGGEVACAEAIINIINQNIDLIEVVGYGSLMSCGFDIFFKIKCPRLLLPNTMGMCHQAKVSIEINESASPYGSSDKADKLWMKLQAEQTLKFCEDLKMTPKEIGEIKRGKDVYFQYKRMQDFLKTQQK
jgi:ATP-dependent protease ClpP protease subunit